MSKKILVTGSIAYDILLGYDGNFADAIDHQALDSLSLSFFSTRYVRRHGGTGANIAWGLKVLKQEPLLVSSVGYDADEYLNKLKKFGIDTTYIQKISDYVTATAIVNTDNSEHQISFFHPGADSHGQWPTENLSSNDIVYAIVSPRDTTAMVLGMEWCKEHQIPVLFDPGQQIIAFKDDVLRTMIKISSGIVVNEYEWEVLCKKAGIDNEEEILELLNTVGSIENEGFVIVTLGDKGCRVISIDESFDIPAFKIDKVINPTGAGDAFRAGLLAGLVEGKNLKDFCRLGTAMGAVAVGQEGTLLEGIDRSKIEAIIDSQQSTIDTLRS